MNDHCQETTQLMSKLVIAVKNLQELLDLYTESEGFTSKASKDATKLLRELREKEVI